MIYLEELAHLEILALWIVLPELQFLWSQSHSLMNKGNEREMWSTYQKRQENLCYQSELSFKLMD